MHHRERVFVGYEEYWYVIVDLYGYIEFARCTGCGVGYVVDVFGWC